MSNPIVTVLDLETVVVDGVTYATRLYWDTSDLCYGLYLYGDAAEALQDAQDSGALADAAAEWERVDNYSARC